MAGVKAALAEMLTYVEDDRHGYVLGSHSSTQMVNGTDCSGAARKFAALVEGVPLDTYPDFSTATQRSVLVNRGWDCYRFEKASLQPGDILLTAGKGHTVIWFGSDLILGAEGDWDGMPGDSSGKEVCLRTYYDFGYAYILRWPRRQEDDLTSEQAEQLRFLYEHLHWDETTKFSGLGNLVSRMPITYGEGEAKTTAALGDRLAYIDAHTHTVDKKLDRILAILEA
ncbi:hypothetical protein [Collinsella ihumii]|uniref:hypothetical protein n=1 Tax=Collinsella ihumii TaxID=1720204 RepID=UPI0025AAEE3B|nr:hypothetical protein [Collinsella ihumii]MDN0056367.1 hypothetical protein [Collinsella ihumii]